MSKKEYRAALMARIIVYSALPNSIKCYKCKHFIEYTDNDIKSDVYVICLNCKEKIMLIKCYNKCKS